MTLALALVAGPTGCASTDAATQATRVPQVTYATETTADVGMADVPALDAVTDPVTDAGAPPAESTAAGPVVETMVWVPAGDHQVPGTLALPVSPPQGRMPGVLMLHGDLGSRDETGDLFGHEAADLAGQGIASLRIDFAGSGDSTEPDLALDYPNMVADATASVRYLQSDPWIDPNRVAVLGLSRGGSIAATLAGTVPGVAALVEWSGAVYNGYDEDPAAHEQARTDGYVPIDVGDRDFMLSLNWYDTIEQSHPLDDVAGYRGPVLAVVGSDDNVVSPDVADVFLKTVASTDTTLHTVADADHLYGAYSDDQSHADEARSVTTAWLASRLTA